MSQPRRSLPATEIDGALSKHDIAWGEGISHKGCTIGMKIKTTTEASAIVGKAPRRNYGTTMGKDVVFIVLNPEHRKIGTQERSRINAFISRNKHRSKIQGRPSSVVDWRLRRIPALGKLQYLSLSLSPGKGVWPESLFGMFPSPISHLASSGALG